PLCKVGGWGRGRGCGRGGGTPGGRVAWGGGPPISSPRNLMEPPEGSTAPETQLKHVVLPEPFGPISPRISPGLTSKETLWRARKPPKRLVSPETISTDAMAAPPAAGRADGAVG